MIRLLLFSLLTSSAFAQYMPAGPHFPSSTGGTLSFVQKGNCTIANASSTCTATMGAALTAGNGYIFSCYINNSSATSQDRITGVTAGGTLKLAPGASTHGGVVSGTEGNTAFTTVAYILPSTSTGGSTTEVITLSAASSSTGGNCAIHEYHPSANPNNVALSLDGSLTKTAACTSCASLATTIVGGDFVFQNFVSANGFQAPSAAATPYNTNFFAGSDSGFSSALPSTGASFNWTSTSTQPTMATLAFAYNPPASSEYMFFDGAGLSNGTAATAATLTTSTHGYQGGSWGVSGTLAGDTTNINSTLTSVGRLLGDGVTYTGTGVASLKETGTGSATTTNAKYPMGVFTSNPSVSMAQHFCSTLLASDGAAVDIGQLGLTNNDEANVTFASDVFKLETVATVAGPTYSNGTGCGVGGTGWWTYHVQANLYQQVAVVSASVTGGIATFTCGGSCTGSVSGGDFIAANWSGPPANEGFLVTGCTGGSGFNGTTTSNAGPYFNVATLSATTITSAAGSATGSATGCTLTTLAAMAIFNTAGTQQGSTVYSLPNSSTGFANSFTMGHLGSQTVTNTRVNEWGPACIALDGTFPIASCK